MQDEEWHRAEPLRQIFAIPDKRGTVPFSYSDTFVGHQETGTCCPPDISPGE